MRRPLPRPQGRPASRLRWIVRSTFVVLLGGLLALAYKAAPPVHLGSGGLRAKPSLESYLNSTFTFSAITLPDGEDMFAARGVCLHRTEDGLVVPSTAAIAAIPSAARRLLPAEGTGCNRPLCAVPSFGFDFYDYEVLRGRTLMIDCWRRPTKDTNPYHWLIKVGRLFELSEPEMVAALQTSFGANPVFDNIVFHGCANPFKTRWSWAEFVWRISVARWGRAGLWTGRGAKLVWTEDAASELTCLDNVLFDSTYGIWFSDAARFKGWRSQAAALLQQPALEVVPQTLCVKQPRIKVYQRTSGASRRSFLNLAEVIAAAQAHTSIPVEVFSTNEGDSFENQTAAFQSMDIFINPHGSHISNMIFAPMHAVVIEVAPGERDLAFQWNVLKIGIADYLLSFGHQVAADCYHALLLQSCSLTDKARLCSREVTSKLTQCDIHVDIPNLQRALSEAMAKLCPGGAG